MRQIYERNGGVEISLTRDPGTPPGPDVLWRVRILGVSELEILVEKPAAAGRGVELPVGAEVMAVMSVGQNRWMFRTRIIALGPSKLGMGGSLRLAMPTEVSRCQRRDFYRVPTASLQLPRVQCWKVLEPASVVAAEVANRSLILGLERGEGGAPDADSEAWVLPTVGSGFSAHLMNVGGGGIGLLVDKGEAGAALGCRNVWMKVDLRPSIPAPLGMAAKIVHTHLDHEQNVYLGMAFEFSANAGHREFVVSQILRYVGIVNERKAA